MAYQNCVIAAQVKTDVTKALENSGAIYRFEFIETVVRVALTKYKSIIQSANAKPAEGKVNHG